MHANPRSTEKRGESTVSSGSSSATPSAHAEHDTTVGETATTALQALSLSRSKAAAPSSSTSDAAISPTVPSSFSSVQGVHDYLRLHPHQLLLGCYEGIIDTTVGSRVSAPLVIEVESIGPARMVEKIERERSKSRWEKRADENEEEEAERDIEAPLGGTGKENRDEDDAPEQVRMHPVCDISLVWREANHPSLRAAAQFYPESGIIRCLQLDDNVAPEKRAAVLTEVNFISQTEYTEVNRDGSVSRNGGRAVMIGYRMHDDGHRRFECTLAVEICVQKEVSGSPISQQPMQTLALVCRFLAPRDLLSAYQSNKLLSSAASHPLTFQNGCQTGLREELGAITTYARGPSAFFTDPKKMKSAFESRLFRHFRIVRLQLQGAPLPKYLSCCTPSLRSLTIDATSYSSSQFSTQSGEIMIQKVWTPEVTQALKYLTHLHLIGPDSQLVSLMLSIPPSVELLHVTFTRLDGDHGALVFEEELLKPTCGVRTVLYDASSSEGHRSSHASLIGLRDLSQERRLEKVIWNIPIRLDAFDWNEPGLKDYTCEKLDFLRVSGKDSSILPHLARFPDVTRLNLRWYLRMADHFVLPLSAHWPACTRNLQQLTLDQTGSALPAAWVIRSLSDGDFPRLDTLHLYGMEGEAEALPKLFAKLPSLTDLHLSKLSRTSTALASLQNLLYLRGLSWEFQAGVELEKVFPKLTYLHVSTSVESLPLKFMHTVQSIPHLIQLKWRAHPVIHPREIASHCARAESLQKLRLHHGLLEGELRDELQQHRQAIMSRRAEAKAAQEHEAFLRRTARITEERKLAAQVAASEADILDDEVAHMPTIIQGSPASQHPDSESASSSEGEQSYTERVPVLARKLQVAQARRAAPGTQSVTTSLSDSSANVWTTPALSMWNANSSPAAAATSSSGSAAPFDSLFPAPAISSTVAAPSTGSFAAASNPFTFPSGPSLAAPAPAAAFQFPSASSSSGFARSGSAASLTASQEKMQAGCLMQSYSGLPEGPTVRNVWVWWEAGTGASGAKQLGTIYVVDNAARKNGDVKPDRESLPLSKIRDVFIGKQSAILKAPALDAVPSDRCFTLGSQTLQLHLQAESSDVRAAWLQGLQDTFAAAQVSKEVAAAAASSSAPPAALEAFTWDTPAAAATAGATSSAASSAPAAAFAAGFKAKSPAGAKRMSKR
jgi:hypothetical protein